MSSSSGDDDHIDPLKDKIRRFQINLEQNLKNNRDLSKNHAVLTQNISKLKQAQREFDGDSDSEKYQSVAAAVEMMKAKASEYKEEIIETRNERRELYREYRELQAQYFANQGKNVSALSESLILENLDYTEPFEATRIKELVRKLLRDLNSDVSDDMMGDLDDVFKPDLSSTMSENSPIVKQKFIEKFLADLDRFKRNLILFKKELNLLEFARSNKMLLSDFIIKELRSPILNHENFHKIRKVIESLEEALQDIETNEETCRMLRGFLVELIDHFVRTYGAEPVDIPTIETYEEFEARITAGIQARQEDPNNLMMRVARRDDDGNELQRPSIGAQMRIQNLQEPSIHNQSERGDVSVDNLIDQMNESEARMIAAFEAGLGNQGSNDNVHQSHNQHVVPFDEDPNRSNRNPFNGSINVLNGDNIFIGANDFTDGFGSINNADFLQQSASQLNRHIGIEALEIQPQSSFASDRVNDDENEEVHSSVQRSEVNESEESESNEVGTSHVINRSLPPQEESTIASHMRRIQEMENEIRQAFDSRMNSLRDFKAAGYQPAEIVEIIDEHCDKVFCKKIQSYELELRMAIRRLAGSDLSPDEFLENIKFLVDKYAAMR